MTQLAPDPEVIRATWRWLAHGPHGVSEVRVIRPGGGITGIGFFDDEDAFVRECVRSNAASNVYVGIQPRPRSFFERAPNTLRPLRNGATRKDIEVVTATVIDLDPKREKDTASTDAELEGALEAARAASDWCVAEGLRIPRLMMSGNGAQLWFAVPPTPLEGERHARIQEGMKAFELSVRGQVESETVKVDSIHDLARIIKVIGTVSRKGDGKPGRPHRLSQALTGFERVEDAGLLGRFESPPAPLLPLPLGTGVAAGVAAAAAGGGGAAAPAAPLPPPEPGRTLARRTADGGYDWEHPVDLCPPIQKLWAEGAKDRSLAIFDMVRFFAHKGLGLGEITDLITEYDRRGLGKLTGRDAGDYVRQAFDKIKATARADGTIAPPCHSLQKLGYCRANRQAGIRCELSEANLDIEKAIEEIPLDLPARDLEKHLQPILEAVALHAPSVHGVYFGLIEKRLGLKVRDLRKAMAHYVTIEKQAEEDDREAELAAIEGEVYEDAHAYLCVSPRGVTQTISSFTIEPSLRIVTDEGEIILGDAHTDRGTVVKGLRFEVSAFHSRRDLMRHLPSADLQWTGNDNNVQGLLRVLARRPVPTCRGSKLLGDYEDAHHHVWLGPDSVIGKEGFLNPPPVVYVPNGGSLDRRLRYEPTDDATFAAIARAVFEYLPQLNLPEVMLPIIGWFFATPMKPKFYKERSVRSFPLLMVWGTQGSGKSSICADVMWPLFGVPGGQAYSATDTEFALIKLLTATRSVPAFIDEYKPYDMKQSRTHTLHRCLRRIFKGDGADRGRADLTVSTFELVTPICMAGETRPVEPALLERMIVVSPSKTTLEEREECRIAFRALRALNLPLFAPRYIQFCLGRDFDAEFDIAKQVTLTLIGDRKVPTRVIENISTMVFGVHLFEEFAKECGCTLPSDLGIERAIDGLLKEVVEGKNGVKTAFDRFLEVLGAMAVQGFLKYRMHYTFSASYLALHLESAYDAFRSHCKNINYDGEILDIKALRRLITENKQEQGFVVAESERVYFNGSEDRRRAVVIDLSKTEFVSAEDFPARGEMPAGGFGDAMRGTYRWNNA